MLSDTITFEVDFNDRDQDGLLLASMRFASGARYPEPGERVWVADDEGNACEGDVAAVDGLIIHIDLDRGTWTRNQNDVANPFVAPVVVGDEEGWETTGVELTLV